jgi:geranylgeranyl diphosphate synthase type I
VKFDKDVDFERELDIMSERSEKTRKLFEQMITYGVTNFELLSIFEEIKDYRRDILRPSLVALAYEAVGGRTGGADEVSLMATILGVGIGIHDDIIDKCQRKHFRKTVHGSHGGDKALLVGDLLIVKGLTMIRRVIMANIKQEQILEILKTFEVLLIKVCESQFEEISFRRNLSITLDEYIEFLHHSVAEIEACARLGAIIGNGSDKDVRLLGDFGRNYGVMLRLLSDVIDIYNVEGNLKQRLEDESIPLSILYSAKSSERIFNKINSLLKQSHISQEEIAQITEICLASDAFTYIYNLAEKISKELEQKLKALRSSQARDVLSLMMNNCLRHIAEMTLKDA